jgi:hypothetical protein
MTATDYRMTRRSIFIGVAASLLCAPAIVRAASLMPVRSLILPIVRSSQLNGLGHFYRRNHYHYLDFELRTGRPMTKTISSYPGEFRIISVAEARREVAQAWAQGWMAPYSPKI